MSAFERFRATYGSTCTVSTGSVWYSDALARVDGYTQLAGEFAGAQFEGGLYRFHNTTTGSAAVALIAAAFPDFAGSVTPFAYDWLGRQFTLDQRRIVNGEPQVLLLDPGAGEALQIPQTFVGFHEEELVDYPDDAVAKAFFASWRSSSDYVGELKPTECVGYQVPLFLGGLDQVDNLELVDVDVYWAVCGQLRLRAATMRPGDTIRSVTLN